MNNQNKNVKMIFTFYIDPYLNKYKNNRTNIKQTEKLRLFSTDSCQDLLRSLQLSEKRGRS